MKDKVGASDQISFILNGKPIVPKPTMVCPKCGTNRFEARCPLSDNMPRMLNECPMQVKAQ